MANLSFKLGSLDLSNYVRVNPENKMNPSPGDVFEPAFSDSPLFEGQMLTSIHAKNKELAWPLFVHPNFLSEVAYKSLIIGDRPVAYWRLDESGNGRVAIDQTGTKTPNLITNPNFESDMAGWSTVGTLSAITTSTGWSSTGSRSLRLTAPATTGAFSVLGAYTTVNLVAGQSYSLAARVNVLSLTNGMSVLVGLSDNTGSFAWGTAFAQTNSLGVQRITVANFVAPTTGTYRLNLSFDTNTNAGNNASGDAYFDEVILVASSTVPSFYEANGGNDGDYLGAPVNLCTQPLDTATQTNWLTTPAGLVASGGATLTADATQGTVVGATAGKVVTTATGQGIHSALTGTFKQGVTYTLSFYARTSAGTLSAAWGMEDNNLGNGAASTGGTITSSWTRFTINWTPTASSPTPMAYIWANAAGTFWVNGVQVTEATNAPVTFSDTQGFTLGQGGALAEGDTAVLFDGQSGSVKLPALTSSSAFTLETWVKPTSQSNAPGIIAPFSDIVSLMQLDGANNLRIYNGSTSVTTTGGLVPNGSWTHLVITWDGTNVTLYINGVAGAAPQAMAFPASPQTPCIGAYQTNSNFFQGAIDEPAVYNYALSAAQVAQHYQNGRYGPMNQTDMLNQLIQQINQQLRPVVDLGQPVTCQWANAQASFPTNYTVQFGRFEPDFNFRQTEKGWLAGVLRLWVLPYGHTATERILGTWQAPTGGPGQSGLVVPAASMTAPAAGGTIVGDAPPQLDLRVTVGSYLGDDGRLGIISALPVPSYNPIIPVGSFIGASASAVIYGASGAWASQFLAMDNIGGSQGAAVAATQSGMGNFKFALSPASVYAGDNRVLGLVRGRLNPFGLRAFDPAGNPLGPTVIASAMDGWQIVDYGMLRLPPWMATAVVSVQSYPNLPYTASGMFAPERAAPGWTQEHGPIFVVPNGNSILDLDWNSPALSIDGFDSGASGAVPGQDMMGNSWTAQAGAFAYTGLGGVQVFPYNSLGNQMNIGSAIAGDCEVETVFNLATTGVRPQIGVGRLPNTYNVGVGGPQALCILQGASSYLSVLISLSTQVGSIAIPTPIPGRYHLRMLLRGSQAIAYLNGPSGAYVGAASGAALVSTGAFNPQGASYVGGAAGLQVTLPGATTTFTFGSFESFRARLLPTLSYQGRDILHLHQPNQQNTRMTPSAIDAADLQARQRGPLGAVALPVPSLGAGVFAASFPWDQGPANDLLNVDIRVRERFSYAR